MSASDRSEPALPVPRGVRIAGAWSWNIVLIVAASAIVIWGLAQIRLVVVPLLLAALMSALLLPAVDAMTRRKVPRMLAVAIVMLLLLCTVSGLLWLAVAQLRQGYPELQERAIEFWEATRLWLLDSPLNISQEDLNSIGRDVVAAIRADAQSLLSSALSVGTTAGHVVAGLLLTLFTTLFFLLDGGRIWQWTQGFVPSAARPAVNGAASAGWQTLGNFVRVQVLVALIDAVGIGFGAWLLGVPLAAPIAILVFLGSFIPVVGAVLTGTLAVFIALVSLGPIKALIMLAIVLGVQQVESHVLQPIIMGSAVSIHPLGVVLAVATGSIVAGIPGALFAVPLAAFVNVFAFTIVSRTEANPGDSGSVPARPPGTQEQR
ncbi:MAG: AI-2E family transporter [Propionibacteriaceae bacterium]|nr:AI-2E family transporter [Propionibacteriaceae bacterium]